MSEIDPPRFIDEAARIAILARWGQTTELSAIDAANLLAGHAVAAATAFLDGRHDWQRLLQDIDGLQASLLSIDDVGTHHLLQPVRLLVIAMRGAALTGRALAGAAPDRRGLETDRLDRWEQVMGSVVELVRQESRALLAPADEADAS